MIAPLAAAGLAHTGLVTTGTGASRSSGWDCPARLGRSAETRRRTAEVGRSGERGLVVFQRVADADEAQGTVRVRRPAEHELAAPALVAEALIVAVGIGKVIGAGVDGSDPLIRSFGCLTNRSAKYC